MSIPDQFPRRVFRPVALLAPGNWPWQRAALLACIAARLIMAAAGRAGL